MSVIGNVLKNKISKSDKLNFYMQLPKATDHISSKDVFLVSSFRKKRYFLSSIEFRTHNFRRGFESHTGIWLSFFNGKGYFASQKGKIGSSLFFRGK